jgi:hypothetical protein
MSRIRWISTASSVVVGTLLGAGGCSGGGSSAATGAVEAAARDAGAAADGANDSAGCTTDADCASKVPPTTPADCAVGRCDAIQGTCSFLAKDEDGDGHPAGNCVSTTNVAVQAGDDCNDQDPNLYPGHGEPCSTGGADGGTVTWPTGMPTGICTYGRITCTNGTTQSACTGVTPPAARDCTSAKDNDCDGQIDSTECACVPPAVQCASNGIEACTPDGAWGAPQPCVNQTCVSGVCQGSCAPGQTQCTGNGVQTCEANGSWSPAVSCGNKTCVSSPGTGACQGVCAPGQTECSGTNGVATCNPSGNWGAAVACTSSTCSGAIGSAKCAGTCGPTDKTCSGNSVETCSSGQFGSPTSCGSQTCVNAGVCTGVCAVGSTRCSSNTQPQTCNASGVWVNDAACTNSWCNSGTCTGNCAPGQTQAGTVSNCTPVYAQSVPGSCVNGTLACTTSCAAGTYAGQPCQPNPGAVCNGTPVPFNSGAGTGNGVNGGAFVTFNIGANCFGSTNYEPPSGAYQVCPNGSVLTNGGLTCNVNDGSQGFGGTCSTIVASSNSGILKLVAHNNCAVGMSATMSAQCIPNNCSQAP